MSKGTNNKVDIYLSCQEEMNSYRLSPHVVYLSIVFPILRYKTGIDRQASLYREVIYPSPLALRTNLTVLTTPTPLHTIRDFGGNSNSDNNIMLHKPSKLLSEKCLFFKGVFLHDTCRQIFFFMSIAGGRGFKIFSSQTI